EHRPDTDDDVVAVGRVRLERELPAERILQEAEPYVALIVEELVHVVGGRLWHEDTDARADRHGAEQPGHGRERLLVLVVVSQLQARVARLAEGVDLAVTVVHADSR